jgi:hypothetical protein
MRKVADQLIEKMAALLFEKKETIMAKKNRNNCSGLFHQ